MKNKFLTDIDKKSLSSQVVDKLKNHIINNNLKPGDKLPTETQLMELLKVSRSTIREAIKQIQIMGIIDVRQGKGSIVKRFDVSEAFKDITWALNLNYDDEILMELFETRYILETGILPLIIERITEDTLDELRIIMKKMKSKVSILEFRKLDAMFHRTLIDSTGNRPIIHMSSVILSFFDRISIKYPQKTSTGVARKDNMEEHQKILSACEKHDLKKLQSILEIHLGRYKKLFKI